MPGTRTRRAREYRPWAISLKLIGQRPTTADGVKHRMVDLVCLVHLVYLVGPVNQINQTNQLANGDVRAAARTAQPKPPPDRSLAPF